MNILLLINLLTLLIRPTFSSCGIESDNEVKGSTVRYCETGKSKWTTVTDFQGSIFNLKEDTEYKVRIERAGQPVEEARFRTWKSDVPVARTIEIDPATFKAPFKVDQKGTENGWIRITAKGGRLHNPTSEFTFDVEGAEYVLLDDMILTGAEGSPSVIDLKNCKCVRIRNCDISGWGTPNAKQSFVAKYGKDDNLAANGRYMGKDGKRINYEGAIFIRKGAEMTVVERCYIHDPLCTSTSWYYTHPCGPQAVIAAYAGHSTILRWNDFIGSDLHRWNDAVEGPGNFSKGGGLNRDADIYGNFMIFANDDCIELDGGQRNVRCFGNRYESALCGVSVQGCMEGPSFVYDNLFSGMGEEFGLTGQTVKTSEMNGEGATTYVYDNMLWGGGIGIRGRMSLINHIFRNKFYGSQEIRTNEQNSKNVIADANEFGLELDEKDLPVEYPKRPLGFTLSRARISVGLDRNPVTVKMIGKLPKGSVIRKPEAMDWLLPEIKGSEIIICFDDSKMHDRRNYRGAFIVRTPEGLSRPVSVYATTDFIPPFHAEKEGDFAMYAENFKLEPQGSTSVSFDVPKDGVYWLMFHGAAKFGELQEITVSLDGKELGKSLQQQYDYPTWTMFCPGPQCSPINLMVYHLVLNLGKHTFKIDHSSGDFPFDGLVLTDNPKSFEPR